MFTKRPVVVNNVLPPDLAKGQQDYCRNCGRARPKVDLDDRGNCPKCAKIDWNRGRR